MTEQKLMDALAHNYVGNCGKCGDFSLLRRTFIQIYHGPKVYKSRHK